MDGDFAKYARQTALGGFGEDGQRKLESSKLVIIGAGGIGSAALPLLAGAGVGQILIVDCDDVAETNLHRQTIYRHDEIGQSKAEAAAQKMRGLNPCVNPVAHAIRLENASQLVPLLSGAHMCIDATDSFFSRFLVADACEISGANEICASAEHWVSQLVCFGAGFRIRDFMADADAANERARGLPIFGPAAALAGVWAAALALRVLAGIQTFTAGKFERYSFENNKHLKIEL